jgi:hypothetical protein
VIVHVRDPLVCERGIFPTDDLRLEAAATERGLGQAAPPSRHGLRALMGAATELLDIGQTQPCFALCSLRLRLAFALASLRHRLASALCIERVRFAFGVGSLGVRSGERGSLGWCRVGVFPVAIVRYWRELEIKSERQSAP